METYQLTHPQKRVWYNEKLYPHTSLHNIGGLAIIRGNIRLDFLEQAILLFIRNNDAVLLRVAEVEGTPCQYLGDEIPQALDFFDFSNEEDPQTTFSKWANATFQLPFSSLDGRLFYFATFKTSDKEMGYLAKFHHLICDGWSILLISQQVTENYELLLVGKHGEITSNPSYLEYLHEENTYLDSPRFFKDKSYWLDKFTTLPEYNNLQAQANGSDIRGRRQTYLLGLDTIRKVRAICEQWESSLASFFISLFLIYFRFHQQKNDLVIGIPVFNRIGRKNRHVFGMYTSTMPLRVIVDSDWSISQLFKYVNGELKANLTHQRYPYDLLVKDLELRQKGYQTLFNVCVNYYNTQLVNKISGFPIENEEIHNGYQLFDLQLVINEWSSRISLNFDYKVTQYAPSHIDELFTTFEYLIDQIALAPTITLRALTILPQTIRQKLLVDFNQFFAAYPADKTLPELIEQQALLTPLNIAVSYQDKTLTYQQLVAQANQVARFLLSKGVKVNSLVGFMAHKELGLLAGILGILKTGAAYIPFDPDTPVERVKIIMNNADARYLLSSLSLDLGEMIETLLLSDTTIARQVSDFLPPAAKANDPVYVIFTSGSTGEPKGVVIEHKSLINYLWWAKTTYIKGEHEIFALHSSLAFDLTVTSLFAPLLAGAQIRIYGSDDNIYALHRVIQENIATIVKLTPSELSLFLERDNSHSAIKTFIVGGEDLKVNLALAITETFSPQSVDIYNEYGPTETVVGCMIHRYDAYENKGLSVPIGVPVANVAIYILDSSLQPLPVGAIGELYISGDCVGRGYLNNAALTNDRFLDNPFVPGWRMYKSGDLARLTPQQTIVYLGRKDDQVKVRGYRIELGEINSHLRQMPLIKEAVVVKEESETGHSYLCAYLVVSDPIDERTIRDFLSISLPYYMIPTSWYFLKALPLSPSGKVDKNALPKPYFMSDPVDYLPPSTLQETLLINIIAKTLEVENIGLNHNFLELGGDSIKAIQVAAKLQQQNYTLPTTYILSHPVIREMAQYLERIDTHENNEETIAEGIIEPTPILYWFLERNLISPQQYHQSILLELHITVPIEEMATMIQLLLQQHRTLCLNLQQQNNLFFYNSGHLKQRYKVKQYDLSALSLMEARQEIAAIGIGLKTTVNLETDCLFQAVQFQLAGERQILLLIAHHIIIDGVSWQILLDDLLVLLHQHQTRMPYTMTRRTLSYQAWSLTLRQHKVLFEKQLAYWQNIVRSCADTPLVLSKELNAAARHTLIHKLTITSKMLHEANKTYRTRTNELLLVALSLVFYRWQNLTELPLWIEGHGREPLPASVDLTRTVGWFTAIYPIYLSITGHSLAERITTVKTYLRDVPTGGVGYGVLRYLDGFLADITVPLIRFNYLGEWDTTLDTPLISRLDWNTGEDVSAHNQSDSLMDLNIIIVNQQMEIFVSFMGDQEMSATVHHLLERYIEAIYEVVEHCQKKEVLAFTVRDFDTVNLTESDLDALFD